MIFLYCFTLIRRLLSLLLFSAVVTLCAFSNVAAQQGADNLVYRLQLPAEELAVGDSASVYVTIDDVNGSSIPNISGTSVGIRFNQERLQFLGIRANVSSEFIWNGSILGPFVITRQEGNETIKFVDIARSGSQSIGIGPGNVFRMDFIVTATGETDFEFELFNTSNQPVMPAIALAEPGGTTVYNNLNFENKTFEVGVPLLNDLPDNLDFGIRPTTSTTVKELEIVNTGEGKMQVSAEVAGTGFRLLNPDQNAITLFESESALIPIRFLPNAAGHYTGELILTHNAENESSPAVIELSGEAESPGMQAVLSPLQFVVRSGDTALLELQLANTAEQVAVLNATLVAVPAEISLMPESWTGPPGTFDPVARSFSLGPGDSGALTLAFSTALSQTEVLNRFVRISSNDPVNPLQNFSLQATVQAAAIAADPPAVSFGEVVRGDTVFQDFELINEDAALLSGSLPEPPPPFFYPDSQPLSFSLAEGERFEVTIGLEAESAGPLNSTLEINHDGHNMPSPFMVPLAAEILPFGTPDRLQMVTEPTDAVFGEPLEPAVRVEVTDIFGNRVTNADAEVTVALSESDQQMLLPLNNLQQAPMLIGDLSVQVAEGVAEFDNLRVSQTGTNALNFSSLSLSSVVSTSFQTLPRLIQITADPQVKQLGDEDPRLTFSFTPDLVGDDSFSGSLSREAGEDIGIYAITQGNLSLNENYETTFTGSFLEIIPAQLTVQVSDTSKIFGESDPEFEVTFEGFMQGDGPADLDGTLSFTREAGEDAGTYAVTASGLSAPRYDITFLPGTLEINPLTISVEALPASKGYGDADPELSFTFSPDLIGTDTFNGSLVREAGENTGTYSITQGSLSLSPNYNISFTEAVFTILPSPLTVNVADAEKIYGDPDPDFSLLFEGFQFGEDASVLEGTAIFSREPGEDSGSYIVQASGLSSANYVLTFEPGSLSITPLLVSVTAEDAFKQLGLDDPPLTFTVVPALIEGDSFSGSLTREPGESVGIYEILQGTLSLSQNYEISFTPGIFEILPGGLVIRTLSSTKIFGQPDPLFSVSYIGFVGDDDENVLEGELSFTRESGEDAGLYAVMPSGLSSPEYEITFLSGNLEILPLDITIVPDALSKTYGSEDPPLTYSFSPELAEGDSFSGSLNRDQGELPGSYEIQQGSLTLSPNYDITLESRFFEILPAALSITANDAQKTYGDADSAFSVRFEGFVFEDDADILEGEPVFSREPGENAGTYMLQPGGYSSDLYDLSFLPGTLTINRKALTLTAHSSAKVYGDEDPEFTFTATPGLIEGDAFSGRLLREPGELTGSYVIVQGTLTPGPNYQIDYIPADLLIEPRPLIVQALDAEKAYGDADPEFEAAISGFAPEEGPENLSGTLAFSREPGEDTGSYLVTPGGLSSGQYDISFLDGSLFIQPRFVSVAGDSLSKKEGEEDPPLTFSFNPELIPGDSFSGTLTREPGELPGNYSILQGSLSLSDKYEISYLPGNLEIEALLPVPLPLDPVPANAAEAVTFDTEISVTFSLPVFENDFSGIMLLTADGDEVPLTGITLENNRISLQHEGLENFTTYEVFIPADAVRNADQLGNEAYSWGFQTKDAEPPVLFVIAPEDAEIEEDPDTGALLLNLNVQQGQLFAAHLGANKPVNWSLANGEADAHFSISDEGELMFLQAAEPGNYELTVISADLSGNQTLLQVQVQVVQQLFILSSENLPDWVEKQPGFQFLLEGEGGTQPYTWTLDPQETPLSEGLSLNSETGRLSGTPQMPGSYSIPLRLTDAAGLFVSKTFSLQVEAAELSLSFLAQPPDTFRAGESMGPITVLVKNQRGVAADWFDGLIQLELLSEGVPQDLLIGAREALPVNGLAFFSGLTIEQAGTGYQLRATADSTNGIALSQGVSSFFQVQPGEPYSIVVEIADEQPAGSLPFRVQFPADGAGGTHGRPLNQNGGTDGNRVPLLLQLLDQYGNPAFFAESDLTVTLISDSETGLFLKTQPSQSQYQKL
ncbi:Putative Ig domain-containing protein [Cyclonatronum proteinivorum]|uniref:Ig domain-containing protein n=1 Tax=Cyclonatronum proteinivorum TaxID=1457365 RepID=A0A345UL05_9BACT|nr:MBG domain-containing protein [Cyclonatronum proteinivorum]AXJ01157.1 Putative Ig domain-containing protein [Cyclonatronum proteinivorum]